MLDQLLGDPMPLPVILRLFDSLDPARVAIRCALAEGLIELTGSDDGTIPIWQWDQWCRMAELDWEATVATLRVRITDKGVRQVR